jgi:putative endonuclease
LSIRKPTNSFLSGSIRIDGRRSYHRPVPRVNRAEPRRRAAKPRVLDESPAARRWSVYLLRCSDGTLYAGATNDMERRLSAHARGRVKYTRGRLPVEVAFVEEVGDKGTALSREASLKRLSRRRKLELCGAG